MFPEMTKTKKKMSKVKSKVSLISSLLFAVRVVIFTIAILNTEYEGSFRIMDSGRIHSLVVREIKELLKIWV